MDTQNKCVILVNESSVVVHYMVSVIFWLLLALRASLGRLPWGHASETLQPPETVFHG